MTDDFKASNYQDDLDTHKTDKFADEYGSKPAEDLRIPEAELKEELDNTALDEKDNEDMRETIEDRDEADDNAASSR